MTVASIFIINDYRSAGESERLAGSKIWIGDDATPWSTSLTLATADPINEGGFINLDRPTKGRYVVLRRDGSSILGESYYTVN